MGEEISISSTAWPGDVCGCSQLARSSRGSDRAVLGLPALSLFPDNYDPTDIVLRYLFCYERGPRGSCCYGAKVLNSIDSKILKDVFRQYLVSNRWLLNKTNHATK